ncbi:hypothetical protein ACFLZY_02990 [Patescibacteria group bacterium]
MAKTSSSTYLFIVAILIVLGLVLYAVLQPRPASEHDALARCLTEKGAKMYAAWWCSHCEDQKRMFGDSFKYIDHIECSPNQSKTFSQECKDADITGTPTWVFVDGSRISGKVPLEKLAEKTGCRINEEGDSGSQEPENQDEPDQLDENEDLEQPKKTEEGIE